MPDGVPKSNEALIFQTIDAITDRGADLKGYRTVDLVHQHVKEARASTIAALRDLSCDLYELAEDMAVEDPFPLVSDIAYENMVSDALMKGAS